MAGFVDHVLDLDGNRVEYNIPPITAAHRRNLAKNLVELLTRRNGLTDGEQRATFGRIMDQLDEKAAAEVPASVASRAGWHRGARVRSRAA